MMLKLARRNLAAHKGRFALTTFGVVLAVSFVVSAFVLGDGLRGSFDDLAAEIVEQTDIEVRPLDEFASQTTLDETDLATVQSTAGVATAVGYISAPENSVRPLTASGDEIPTAGPPQLAFGWNDELSPFTIVEGQAPMAGQFTMDLDSADRHGFEVGQSYVVITATGRHDLVLSGLTRFGSENATLGADLMGMNLDETNSLFGTSGIDGIGVDVDRCADVE